MRLCSRKAAGAIALWAALSTGSETWRLSGVEAQAASSRPKTIAMARAVLAKMLVTDAIMASTFALIHSISSICSGAVASTIGPLRCSINPRTLMWRPSSLPKSMPAAANVRRCRLETVTVKSRVHRRPKLT